MIPILYPETETAFTTNGIGFLSDTIRARVLETLNGSFELELTYPLSGLHAEEITDRRVILAKPDPISDPQPFRIYRINPVSRGTVKVYARHIAYDLMGIPAQPFTAESAADAMAALNSAAVVDCPFTFSTDKSVAAKLSSAVPKAIWKLLGGSEGSILDVYRGEYQFDKYHVKLLSRRGADRGVSIRYGKNLSTLEQDRNCANVCTGVYPYWVSTEGELVQLAEKVLYAGGEYAFVKILDLDLSEKFEEKPTQEALAAMARKYMKDNAIGVPDVSWKVEFVQLEQTEEYKDLAILERVTMGDTVSVLFPAMGVNASARVVETDFDPILERYNTVTLGKVKASLADTIAKQNASIQKQQQQINKKPGAEEITGIINGKLGSIFETRGGSVRLLDTDGDGLFDELYIADDPDPDKAVKVWRFNYLGWAASKNGYNGPFTFGATLEDGLLADFVTAAKLVAGTIQSADGETFFLDLDSGILRIRSEKTTVDGEKLVTSRDLSDLSKRLDNSVTIAPSSQVFTKTSGAASYQPASITLTAQTGGELQSYQWYRDGTLLSGKTGNTLTVKASDFSAKTAVYKVAARDITGAEYTDSVTLAKLEDGTNGADGKDGTNGTNGKDGAPGAAGKDGTNGKDGAAGKDGYTVVLGNEYIEIPVTTERKPTAAASVSCAVSVYQGTKALTPMLADPGEGQFSVSVSGTYPGITVSQSKAGILTVSVTAETAIEDLTTIPLTVKVPGGLTLTAYLNVSANMSGDLAVLVETAKTDIVSLKTNTDSISAEVARVETSTKESMDGIREDVGQLSQKVSATMTAEEVRIEVEKQIGEVDSVKTKMGYSFNDEGLKVAKSGSEMETTITENGMTVTQNQETVLTANSNGVDAKNLHATTYMIVGKNSRFEDYGDGRTGCFYIGQEA